MKVYTNSEYSAMPTECTVGTQYAVVTEDFEPIERKNEQSNETIFVGTTYVLTIDEYKAICNGTFNGEYTSAFRRLERQALLTKADEMKAKANDYISSNIDKEMWEEYLARIIEYKIQVRQTKNQATFPTFVEYPTFPHSPSPEEPSSTESTE
jgi:hypothetical protein